MQFSDTNDLREYLDRLLDQAEKGELSNATIRGRVHIAKAIIDTLKVDIAAAALGRTFDATSLRRARPISLTKVA